MFCPSCGTEAVEGIQRCAKCGSPVGGAGAMLDSAAGQAAPIASLGDRLLALIVDTVLLGALFALVGTWIAVQRGGLTATGFSLTGAPAGITIALVTIAGLAYYWLLEGVFGATLGKMLIGIQVRRKDESLPRLRASFLRNIFRIVDGIGVYLVGLIVAVLSARRQRIGDHVAGTIVVRHQLARAIKATAAAVYLAAVAGLIAGAVVIHRTAPVGSATEAQSPQPSRPTITEAQLGTDATPDYEIVNPATTFPPDVAKIVCVLRVDDVVNGSVITGEWIYDVGSAAAPHTSIVKKTITVTEEGTWTGAFSMEPAHLLPVGSYHIDLYIDNVLARTLSFTVAAK